MTDASRAPDRGLACQWALVPAAGEGGNLIVQPRNRGTAIGILSSQEHILGQDPEAQVLLLPSGHDVADAAILQRSLAAAGAHVSRCPDRPVLLGRHPDEPDSELGYALPGPVDGLPDERGAALCEDLSGYIDLAARHAHFERSAAQR